MDGHCKQHETYDTHPTQASTVHATAGKNRERKDYVDGEAKSFPSKNPDVVRCSHSVLQERDSDGSRLVEAPSDPEYLFEERPNLEDAAILIFSKDLPIFAVLCVK